MTITLNGTTGVVAPEFDGPLDASNLTGALPAIDGSALTGIDTSPPTTYGAVGTYAYASVVSAPTTTLVENTTVAGANLKSLGTFSNGVSVGCFSVGFSSSYLSGTWRSMGYSDASSNEGYYPATLFVRIA